MLVTAHLVAAGPGIVLIGSVVGLRSDLSCFAAEAGAAP